MVVDVEKQIAYWRDGAVRSWRSVPVLEEGEFWAEALFWAHLSVEKALKAHVAKVTKAAPPYIHKLARLAEIAELKLSPEQWDLSDQLSAYQRIARYPDQALPEPDPRCSREFLRRAKEFQEWLLERL